MQRPVEAVEPLDEKNIVYCYLGRLLDTGDVMHFMLDTCGNFQWDKTYYHSNLQHGHREQYKDFHIIFGILSSSVHVLLTLCHSLLH